MAGRDGIYRKYTDFIQDDDLLQHFPFNGAALERVYGDGYELRVHSALLRAVAEIAVHPNSRVRGSVLNFYCGDRGPNYVVAAPRSAPLAICAALESEFRLIEGYMRPGPGGVEGLAPAYRWEQGRIIAYGPESAAGSARPIGELTGQSSDLTVYFRCTRPAAEIGRESYGGLDYEFLDTAPVPAASRAISLFDEAPGDGPPGDGPVRLSPQKAAPGGGRQKGRRGRRISEAQLPLDFGGEEPP